MASLLQEDIRCFLVGGDSTFMVFLERPTWTVEHLREATRPNLDPPIPPPNKLTLYRAAIHDYPDKEMRINELERLCGNLNECKELDDEEKELSESLLRESPPPGKKYYILVQPPKLVSSIYVCICEC